VVATPIGNLEDLSFRARQALAEAEVILCEDTRRTGQMLAALGISKRLERLDAHADAQRITEVLDRLEAGGSFALVSDAGTPGVSDPGALVVSQARARGIVVTPLPGPSAVTTLLSVSGFKQTIFTFRGFFPRKAGERDKELALVQESATRGLSAISVWYESPERISEVLALLAAKQPDVSVVVAKELTKLYERIFAGIAHEVSVAVAKEIAAQGARGEWCFAVEWPLPKEADERGAEKADWVTALQCLLNLQIAASVAAKEVSQQFGVSKNRVYEMALKFSGKK
jgi:16S rRNA (cytidine1402-2'-O)-methyltransferase